MRTRFKELKNSVNKNYEVTPKQQEFICANCDEVLFGGAAGGGKSYAQVLDSLRFAITFAGSKQLVMRRTFPELERSIIMTSMEMFPEEIGSYIERNHRWVFRNGSMIEFGYCDSERDVYKYQSAEYDVIRIDEATHFSEFMFTYLITRIRGVNGFPKQIKLSTNPGGIGHTWVRDRFIAAKKPNQIYTSPRGRTSIFIPSKVYDNTFLMDSDPDYVKRLEELPEDEKRMLLDGDWDVFKGQFFYEFKQAIHVIEPFPIPDDWRRFISLDYGLDTSCALWWAISNSGREYVYRELHEPNLTLSACAERIVSMTGENEKISYVTCSPDLFNRRQETGRSGYEVMRDCGIENMRPADDRRIVGWREVREHIKPFNDGYNEKTSNWQVFSTCPHTINSMTALVFSETIADDAADRPHNVTHAAESVRYGCMSRPRGNEIVEPVKHDELWMFRSPIDPKKGYMTW